MIEARRISVRSALTDVTLTLVAREGVGLSGDIASRSTFLRVMGGLLVPERGTISRTGVDGAMDPSALRRMTSYASADAVPGNGLRIDEYLEFVVHTRGARPTSDLPVGEALARIGLDARQLVATLDAERRACVAIVASLLSAGNIILVDHDLNSLSTAQREPLVAWLEETRDAGAAVVVGVNQDTTIPTLCQRVFRFEGGRLVAIASHPPLVVEAR